MASDTPIRVLSFLVFVAGAIALVWWGIRGRLELYALRDTGASAQGKITEILRDSVGGDQPDQLVVTYSYEVGDNPAISNTETFSVDPARVPKVGDTVRVFFDPKRPEYARLERKGW